jgi:hypothetical protein
MRPEPQRLHVQNLARKIRISAFLGDVMDDDDELLETLKGLAQSKRWIAQFGSGVRIDTGPEAEPRRAMSEARKAAIRAVWSRLSREDRQALARWREVESI